MSTPTKIAITLATAGVSLLGPLAQAAAPHSPHTGGAADPVVTELMSKALPGVPGKEALMITVDYPPGAADPIHRHDASAFVYVLEGSIVMQVKGGKAVTLTAGQTYYEGPDDIHTVGRNASQTRPARFLVVLIKNPGAPALVPIQ
ncbi:MAG: cupin domain-containing protein [Achromobacter pulmonis]